MKYITDRNLKISGEFKKLPEDFIVEEMPLYEFSGEGEHTIIFIEKRELSTFNAIKKICRKVKFKDKNVGLAGLKDAQAISRQYLSFQLVPEDQFTELRFQNIDILKVTRHNNKLRKGQLRGNKFICRIRNVSSDAYEIANEIIDKIKSAGLPNYYDTQRFGMFDNNHILGMHLLRNDHKGFVDEFMRSIEDQSPEALDAYSSEDFQKAWELTPHQRREHLTLLNILRKSQSYEKAVKTIDKKTQRLYISALQSFLFNEILDARIESNTLNKVFTGDVAYLHRNGAAFVVEDEEVEQKRCESFEISPSGPIFGSKILLPEGEPGKIEHEILNKYNLTPEDFNIGEGLSQKGARRSLRVLPEDLKIQKEDEDNLIVEFSLPSGSYATVFLKELTKSDC